MVGCRSQRHRFDWPIEEVRQAAEDAGRDPVTLIRPVGTPGKPDVLESLKQQGES